jgi:hypothetical protein
MYQEKEVSAKRYKLFHCVDSFLSAPLCHGEHGNQDYYRACPKPVEAKKKNE